MSMVVSELSFVLFRVFHAPLSLFAWNGVGGWAVRTRLWPAIAEADGFLESVCYCHYVVLSCPAHTMVMRELESEVVGRCLGLPTLA